MKGPTAMLWNYNVSDKEEAKRMASLYGEDGTRAVEPGTETETGRNLVRRCGNELGVATWEAYDFDPDTWTCEIFSNREAAELWLSGSLYLDECVELDRQLTQSVKRMAALAANMSGGRWIAGIQEYKDGRKSLSFQLSDDAGFFLITSPICKTSELALGMVRDRVREELADLDPYREALEACRRVDDSSIALDKLAFYEKLKDRDIPVLLGALAVATEQNQRALGRLLADRKFEDMPDLPDAINPMEAAFAEAKGKLLEWKEGGHGDGMYHFYTASSYLDDYHDMADEIDRPPPERHRRDDRIRLRRRVRHLREPLRGDRHHARRGRIGACARGRRVLRRGLPHARHGGHRYVGCRPGNRQGGPGGQTRRRGARTDARAQALDSRSDHDQKTRNHD